MKDLIRNFLLFGSATVIDKIVALLLIPLYARVFTVAEFGTVELIQSFIAVISIVPYLQLETSLQRYYYTEEYKGRLVYTISIAIYGFAVLLMLVGVVFSGKISELLLSDIIYQKEIVLSLFQIPFSISITINSIILRFERQNRRFLAVVIIRVALLVIFVFLLIFKYKLLGLFIAQLISTVGASIISFLTIKSYLEVKFSSKLLQRMLTYALPQFPARVGSTSNAYANRFFINELLNTVVLGLFSMVLKVSSIISLIHSAFMMAWNQFMFQMINNKHHKAIFVSILSLLSPILFLLVSILTLFSYELIYYVMTPEYIDASRYVGLSCLSFSFLILKEVVDIGPKFKEKTHYLSANFFISLIVNLGSLFYLVPLYGLLGAVFSMFLTNLVLLLVSWTVSYKLYPINFNLGEMVINLLPVTLVIVLVYFKHFPIYIRLLTFLIVLIFYSISIVKSVNRYKKLRSSSNA